MTRPQPLPDLWYSRDLLVLREVARRVEEDDALDVDSVAEALGMDANTVGKAGDRLQADGYLTGASVGYGYGVLSFATVTAKGLREVGQWPSPDVAADRLEAALKAAVEKASTPEGKSRARRVLEAFGAAGRDFLVDVASGVTTGQISSG